MTAAPSLQDQLYLRDAHASAGRYEISDKIGEGFYSASYHASVNGEHKIIRFFKLLPNDRLDMKRRNIEAEINNLQMLRTGGAEESLRRAGISLRRIEHTGPRTGDMFAFWENNPITYDGKTFVAYQICSFIGDRSADQIREERHDPSFVHDFGDRFGGAMALFHHAAREVAFPFHRTKEEMGKYDHAYRLAGNAWNAARQAAQTMPERKIHAALAGKIADETLPLFEPGASKKNWHAVHGDLGIGNIITSGSHVTGLVDWDKARIGFRESDFRGIAVIPGMLDAAAKSYETAMRDLTNHEIGIDRALACKVALSTHLFNCNDFPKNLPDGGDESRINREAAEQMIAVDNILGELVGYDASYNVFRPGFKTQAARALNLHPGADLTLR